MISKVCTKCGVEKPLSEFHKGSGPGGRVTRCRKCRREERLCPLPPDQAERRERVAELRAGLQSNEAVCFNCLQIKPVDAFYVLSSGRLASNCKICRGNLSRPAKEAKRLEERVKRRSQLTLDQLERLDRIAVLRTTVLPDELVCTCCLQIKPADSFYARAGYPDKRQTHCKACHYTYMREQKLRTQYGLTPQDFDALVKQQCGCCAICQKSFGVGDARCVVDHDHVLNVVRGLLCDRCNRGIGHFNDCPDILISAAQYLNTSRIAHG